MARIVFAGREVWPFVEGGGLGRYVWAAASVLAAHHEVTILTTARHEPMAGDPRLPAGVELRFVEEPGDDVAPFVSSQHAWSVRLLEAVRETGPDLVEFADYLGEGFATVHARRGGDPRLRDTSVVVRAHASAEIVYALDERPAEASNGLTWAFERFTVRHADALLWPGGDVLERYERFYGTTAPGAHVPMPVAGGDVVAPGAAPAPEEPLRLLYLGRYQRVKGVLELAEAMRRLGDADVRLTMVGGDTLSAPGGGSMREHLAELLAGDERVELRDPVPHGEVPELIAAHHAVVVPTRWETYSYVTREALAAGRPVLATRVGAIPDAVRPGSSGWLADSCRPDGLAAAIRRVDVAEAAALASGGGLREALETTIPSGESLAASYAELAARPGTPAAAAPARVGAVVAVRPGDADVGPTPRSLAGQRGVRVDVTLVADPLAVPAAASVLRAERLVLGGGERTAMWAAGAAEASHDLLLLVPAGAELEPDFARRACEALADGVDYVTACAARGRRPWHAPLGGEAVAAAGIDAGASVALIRRSALREAATERELFSGLRGVVIQEPLVRRLPRRPRDDGEPEHGGAPAPDAVAAAFGDVLSPTGG